MGNKPSQPGHGASTPSAPKRSGSKDKLPYKRQLSIEQARNNQQTLLDMYSVTQYEIKPSDLPSPADLEAAKSLDPNIPSHKDHTDRPNNDDNKAADDKTKTFSPGIKLEQDEIHYKNLDNFNQLSSEPRSKKGDIRESIKPTKTSLLDENKDDKNVSENDTKNALHKQNSHHPAPADPLPPEKQQSTSINSNENESGSSKQLLTPDKHEKPIIWGYCELTKKSLDEDQAAFSTWTHEKEGFVHAWAIYDGHGGYEVALYSAQHFLKYVEKYHKTRNKISDEEWPGLLKEIFVNFDKHIGTLNLRGGCTVVIVLLVKYKLIIANAGDARAIMSKWDGKAGQLSYDHTPMADYERIVRIAKKPDKYELINKYFRINTKHETLNDVKKLSESEQRKAPLVSRELDKSRLLATIGVARGFGDFNLTVFGFRNIPIKPFLSCEPWVNIVDLRKDEVGETDVLIIACDGVYDVLQNQSIIERTREQLFYGVPMIKPRQDPSKMKKSKSGSKSKSKKNKSDKNENAAKDVYVISKVNGNDNNNNDDDNESELYTPSASNVSNEKRQIDSRPITYERLDVTCNELGKLAYAKGTVDDVSLFLIPLRQIFDCIH